jgi:predicted regulator of Ras-like GTPase activity (Roadblock/LC7/MglB family)
VANPALTPELALDYLDELSTDIRAAVLLDENGALAAHSAPDGDGARMRALAQELFERAEAAGEEPAEPPRQLEVSLPSGAVYALREGGWTLAVITGRFAMASLMFYDLRNVLTDLGRRAA